MLRRSWTSYQMEWAFYNSTRMWATTISHCLAILNSSSKFTSLKIGEYIQFSSRQDKRRCMSFKALYQFCSFCGNLKNDIWIINDRRVEHVISCQKVCINYALSCLRLGKLMRCVCVLKSRIYAFLAADYLVDEEGVALRDVSQMQSRCIFWAKLF